MSVPTAAPSQADAQATFCATFVDEWVRAGVTDAVVCPGSRSTALALALARDARMNVHVRLDERSAGFFALGASLATDRAVVVCTTSGTAAAELHPAVVEAFHSGVPLLICTANRPPRLQSVSAPQVIDQAGLYGSAVLWSVMPGVPEWSGRGTWRSIASRAVGESLFSPKGPGPVHLDLAFDEPLAGSAGELPGGRPGGAAWHEVSSPNRGVSGRQGFGCSRAPIGIEDLEGRVLVVVGRSGGDPESVLGAARLLGAPVLADPLSGCRLNRGGVIAAADALLRGDVVAASLRPDVVIRLGGLHASKVLASRLHEWSVSGTRQVLVDDRWRWADPDRDAAKVVRADPSTWCEEIQKYLEDLPQDRDSAFHDRWVLAESEAQSAIDAWCALHLEATEPGLARCLFSAVPPATTIVVSSSMPIRDLEWYAPAVEGPPEVLANRGANGIDGVVSTALGVGSVGGGPVVAVVGDLAFFHDLTAWVGALPLDPGLTVVVVDNEGGGIFSFLPQRNSLDRPTFEHLFATPQSVEVASVARGLGLEVVQVSTIADVVDAIRDAASSGTTSVVQVKVPERDSNVAHHDALNSLVAERVAAALDGSG
jgi:2-succinyl-5-enolpyruvyl-6-hydroxy-3-cyclohexene-1-carboxylate synthase